jgi:hypothetical protein
MVSHSVQDFSQSEEFIVPNIKIDNPFANDGAYNSKVSEEFVLSSIKIENPLAKWNIHKQNIKNF